MGKKRDHDAVRAFELTEYGLAERLVHGHGEDLRFCCDWGMWLIWDGRIWRRDRTHEIVRRAKAVIRLMRNQAKNSNDYTLLKFASRAESRGKISAMIDLATSEHPIPVTSDDLDRDPFTFACPNGIVDLKTGELRPHNRGDLVTKVSPVIYDPAASCPHWLQFLEDIFEGNPETISVVQRAVGYTLTSLTTEQCLFLLHGTGANGKSTFLTVIQRVLGDYAITAAPGLLAARHGDRHPVDVADLRGARMAISHEWGANKAFDEELVKQLTGDDRLKARFMRENLFEFDPTHKLWIAANHLPQIRQSDYGIWRRVKLIPFLVTISPERRDKQLTAKLMQEAAGILAWAVQGCLLWQAEGLGDTRLMQEAKERYQAEMDILGPFIDARLRTEHAGARTDARVIYEAYREWAAAQGEQIRSASWLSRRLKERGFRSERRGGGWVQWIGVELVKPIPASVGDELPLGSNAEIDQKAEIGLESDPDPF